MFNELETKELLKKIKERQKDLRKNDIIKQNAISKMYANNPELKQVSDITFKDDATQQEFYDALSWIYSSRVLDEIKYNTKDTVKLLTEYESKGNWHKNQYLRVRNILRQTFYQLDYKVGEEAIQVSK